MLVAIGRIPFTDGLGLEEEGVERTTAAASIIDAHFIDQCEGHLRHRRRDRRADARPKAEDEGMAAAKFSRARPVM